MASLLALRPEFMDNAYNQNVNSVNKNVEKNNEKDNEKNTKIKELAHLITEHLKKFKSYHFRPVKIDGINCYVVIHKKYKIINFEAINIKCLVHKQGKKMKQQYSLLFVKYNNIEHAIRKIEDIVATYKVYNGDLVCENAYKQLKLEEVVIPYSQEQVCCICNENTMDTTLCNHYICLHCREQCILSDNTNCPVCRNEEIMNIYNIDNGLINNSSYDILQYAIDYENDATISVRDYVRLHPNHLVSSDSESESDSHDNENEDNESETIIEIEENRENTEETESAQETQYTTNTTIMNIEELNSTDNDDNIMLDGNLILPDIHNEIRQHINSAIQLLSANITVRNRHIIEFNNNWGNVYNDDTSITNNNIGNRIEYGIDNGIVARSPVPFSNNQLEQGEVIETITSYVNSENKKIV
jgi:hypothetical protein